MPDGAAVSTGTTKGVAARLKQLNPRLINFHCVCHRLALACTDSLEYIYVLLDGFLSMHPLTKTVDAEYPASLHTLNTLKNTDVITLGLFSKVKDVFKSSLGLCTFLLNCCLTSQT